MPNKPRGSRNSPLNHDPEAVSWAVKRSGLSQRDIAAALEVAESSVSEWSKGTRNLTQANLVRLAQVLNCPTVVLEAKQVPA